MARQLLREGIHDRVLALAEAVVVERLRQVIGVLAGQIRVFVQRSEAVGSVGCGT